MTNGDANSAHSVDHDEADGSDGKESHGKTSNKPSSNTEKSSSSESSTENNCQSKNTKAEREAKAPSRGRGHRSEDKRKEAANKTHISKGASPERKRKVKPYIKSFSRLTPYCLAVGSTISSMRYHAFAYPYFVVIRQSSQS